MLAIVLASFLLIGLLPADVSAKEEQDIPAEKQNESDAVEMYWYNPIYEDLDPVGYMKRMRDSHLAKRNADTIYSTQEADYSSIREAGAALREAMVNRDENNITVKFSSWDGNLSGLWRAVLDEALIHTGEATEGDYLQWQLWCSGSYDTEGTLFYRCTYFTTAEQEAAVTEAVETLKTDLALEGKSEYEKIKAIYDYITDNVRYDYEHLGDQDYLIQYTAYGALIDKTAVCQGYAVLLYRLLLEYQVECRVVVSTTHAWNIIRIGDLYYNADATWDEGLSPESYWHFLITDEMLLARDYEEAHVREEKYSTQSFYDQYPMAEIPYLCTVFPLYCGPDLTCTISDDGVLKFEGLGLLGYYNPETMDFAPWYYYRDQIRSVEIPYTMAGIPDYAFMDCSNLESITLPYSISIASDAFSGTEGFTIYAYENSDGHHFAEDNGLAFVHKDIPPAEVTLGAPSGELWSGTQYTLNYSISPAVMTEQIVWETSDWGVAGTPFRGTGYTYMGGTATISLTVGAITKTCQLTVKQKADEIVLDRSSLTLEAGQQYLLQATVSPDDAYSKSLTWTSSDPAVATVDADGKVAGLSQGTAKITVTADDGCGAEAICIVEVTGYYVTTLDELQSEHNYADNMSKLWIYRVDNADSLDVTFDEQTEVEEGSDYLYIYDRTGSEIGKYTGTALAGKTLNVPGNTVKIRLVSDSSGSMWGFKVASVTEKNTPGWKKTGNGWRYRKTDNSFVKDDWYRISDKWYHFDKDGYMQTGWQKISGKNYYFNTSGVMQTGWHKIGTSWYYFTDGGAMVTGWRKIGASWYYFAGSGVMQTGWQQISGKWYYFNSSGVMLSGWQKISGQWYYFNNSGIMQTGWQKIDSIWYYFNTGGSMAIGWKTIDSKTYYLKDNGAMAANEWCKGYWLNKDGTWTYPYKASWKQNSKGWWYGDTSGWYAKNTTITIDSKSYTFDASGYMQ